MKNEPGNIAGDVNRVGAFEADVDALIAHQADIFATGHNPLYRSGRGQVVQAMLQTVFGE